LSLLILPSLSQASIPDQSVFWMSQSHQTPEIQTHDKPSLADLLTIEPKASIFYSYARELELSAHFSETQDEMKWTLLVPTNKAVMQLSRKPHQGPVPTEPVIETSELELEMVSKENVRTWISAHIIPDAPISLAGQTYDTLLCGKSVTFETVDGSDESAPEWTRVVFEDHAHIISMTEASNGVLYLVDGTVKVD